MVQTSSNLDAATAEGAIYRSQRRDRKELPGGRSMAMMKPQPTEFDKILKTLQPLSAGQITELVRRYVSSEDAYAFGVLVDGLSADAVRLLAARALLRLRISRVA
jgi:hypothetical protein